MNSSGHQNARRTHSEVPEVKAIIWAEEGHYLSLPTILVRRSGRRQEFPFPSISKLEHLLRHR